MTNSIFKILRDFLKQNEQSEATEHNIPCPPGHMGNFFAFLSHALNQFYMQRIERTPIDLDEFPSPRVIKPYTGPLSKFPHVSQEEIDKHKGRNPILDSYEPISDLPDLVRGIRTINDYRIDFTLDHLSSPPMMKLSLSKPLPWRALRWNIEAENKALFGGAKLTQISPSKGKTAPYYQIDCLDWVTPLWRGREFAMLAEVHGIMSIKEAENVLYVSQNPNPLLPSQLYVPKALFESLRKEEQLQGISFNPSLN